MHLPSPSSIKTENVRRKKLLAETKDNVKIVIEEIRKDPTIKDKASRILVIDRSVKINHKTVSLKWRHSTAYAEEFTKLFHNLLEEALQKEGFSVTSHEENAFIFKASMQDNTFPAI